MSATHPALELFRNDPLGGLSDARFPRWWKTDVTAKDAAGERVATMKSPTAEYSFLAERRYKSGRVLLCSVPLDSSWGTNLTDLPAFVPLAHELVYYLAGARSAEFNLQPGQPIRYRLTSNAPPDDFRLQPPFGEEKPLNLGAPTPATIPAHVTPPPRPTLVCDETRETGVYRLKTPGNRVAYYVVQSDPRSRTWPPARTRSATAWRRFCRCNTRMTAKRSWPREIRASNDRTGGGCCCWAWSVCCAAKCG